MNIVNHLSLKERIKIHTNKKKSIAYITFLNVEYDENKKFLLVYLCKKKYEKTISRGCEKIRAYLFNFNIDIE